MKHYVAIAIILVIVVLGGITAALLHERAHYAQKGRTQVQIRFLGFTNSASSTLRLALFTVSNMSPWAVVRTDYPMAEFQRSSGGDMQLVHSFVGGPKILQAHESEIAFVHLQKVDRQRLWRLDTRFDRYENGLIANLHRLRFFLSDYVRVEVPRWDSVRVFTEWSSE
jgi:hypothetical protein